MKQIIYIEPLSPFTSVANGKERLERSIIQMAQVTLLPPITRKNIKQYSLDLILN